MIFKVIKINRFSRRQDRFLKVTSVGIENIRPKDGIKSSISEWSNVTDIYLKGQDIIGTMLLCFFSQELSPSFCKKPYYEFFKSQNFQPLNFQA